MCDLLMTLLHSFPIVHGCRGGFGIDAPSASLQVAARRMIFVSANDILVREKVKRVPRRATISSSRERIVYFVVSVSNMLSL